MRGAESGFRPRGAWLVAIALLVWAGSHDGAARADPGAVRFVYLIRHGDCTRDAAQDDATGNGLNELGRLQAELVAKRLAALGVPIHALVSSDFTRARETADTIGHALRMTSARDPRLHECTPRRTERASNAVPEPADVSACEANLAAAWSAYFRPAAEHDERDVLVCHGNVIRWLVRRAMGVSTAGWATLDVANAALTVIAVRADGSASLIELNDVGHLPPERQTWLGPGPGFTLTPR